MRMFEILLLPLSNDGFRNECPSYLSVWMAVLVGNIWMAAFGRAVEADSLITLVQFVLGMSVSSPGKRQNDNNISMM